MQITDAVRSAFEGRFIPEPMSGCWLWIGNEFGARGGYGCFTVRPAGIKGIRAHRASWMIYRDASLSSRQHVLHKCDTPACVNPDHLFLGDQPSNMADKCGKGRQQKGDRHGMHKLTEDQARAIIDDERLYTDIAAEYGVTIVTVSDIKRGRSWKHLGERTGRYKRAA